MSLSEQPLLPARGWDELIATSTRRGRVLRRRRRAGAVARLLVAAAVVATLPLGLAAISDPDQDKLLPMPADAPPQDRRPFLLPDAPPPAGGAHAQLPPASTGPLASSAPAASHRGRASTPPAGRPSANPPRLPRVPVQEPVVRFDDARGDAEPTAGASGGLMASDPAHDLVRVTFTAERKGVRARVELAADRNPGTAYFATLTTAEDCEIVLYLDEERDLYNHRCGSVGPYSDYVLLPHVADPSARVLEAFMPYDQFPAAMPPEAPLRLAAESRTPNALGGTNAVDAATTAELLPGRRS